MSTEKREESETDMEMAIRKSLREIMTLLSDRNFTKEQLCAARTKVVQAEKILKNEKTEMSA